MGQPDGADGRGAVHRDPAHARVGPEHDLRATSRTWCRTARCGKARVGRFPCFQVDRPELRRFSRAGPPSIASRVSRASTRRRSAALTFDRIDGQGPAPPVPGAWLGADHHFKIGTQIERGEHRAADVVPGGVQYVDTERSPSSVSPVTHGPSGGRFNTFACLPATRSPSASASRRRCWVCVRSQPGHQSGPQRRRRLRKENRRFQGGPGHALHVERLFAAAGGDGEARLAWPNRAARQLRPVQSGRADRETRSNSSGRLVSDDDGTIEAATQATPGSVDGRSQHEPRSGSQHAHAAYRRVLDRCRSSDPRNWRRPPPTFARRAATSSTGRTRAVCTPRPRHKFPDGTDCRCPG